MTSPVSSMFHVSTLARPSEVDDGPVWEMAGRCFHTIVVPRQSRGAPFAVSFETASQALARLDRLFIELDGSFVWVSSAAQSSAEQPSWQLDGVLCDRGDRLLFVELKGACPQAQLERLLSALGWPATPLVFQLVREALSSWPFDLVYCY